MSVIEPFTPEGVDPNNSYVLTCIDRVNTNYKAAIAAIPGADPTLRTDLNTNIANTNTNTADITTLTTKMNNSYKTINVKDYGVKGDGITIETTALGVAIAAIPTYGGILYFPSGKYLINNTIYISGKYNLTVISDNAEIIVSQTATSAIYFSDCPYLDAVVGSLTLSTTTAGTSTTKIGVIYGNTINNPRFSLRDIKVIGAFYYGMYFLKHDSGFMGSSIRNFTIDGNNVGTNGIYLNPYSQYIEIVECKMSNLLGSGYLMEGGNNTITGCASINCRIGCFIDSISGGNLDHGLINGSTFNHCRACGIFIRSTQLNHAITNCKIWAVLGPDNLTEAANTTARGFHYGVYLENVKGLVLTGNTIAHNNLIDLGIDGMNTSIINNNVFRSVSSAAYTIYEWPNTNNFNNQICNNTFNGTNANVTGRWFGRFYLGGTANDGAYGYLIKDNTGELGDGNYLMDTNSGDYYIGSSNNYVIDGLTITTSSNSDPSTQAANIYILPHATGTKFEISFRRNNLTGFTWLRYKTNSTSLAPYITATNVVYYTAIRCFRIGPINTVKFTPMTTSALGGWCISGS